MIFSHKNDFKISKFYFKIYCKISKFLERRGLRPPNPLLCVSPFFVLSPPEPKSLATLLRSIINTPQLLHSRLIKL